MKRYLFMLLIPLVLLSGCSDVAVKHEDIAYKTKVYHLSFPHNSVDYYVITKDGKTLPVTQYVWTNELKDIPIK